MLCSILGCIVFQSEAQPYQTGIGIRGGATSGLSAKHFIGESAAVEGILGLQFDGFKITGLYELHSGAFDQKNLFWYYGIGAHVGIYNDGYDPPYSDYDYGADPVFGIDGVLGLEYKIEEIPITFSLDIKPFLEFTDPDFYLFDAGLSVRYTF